MKHEWVRTLLVSRNEYLQKYFNDGKQFVKDKFTVVD